eukprot:915605-Prymnesium_polylepis.1
MHSSHTAAAPMPFLLTDATTATRATVAAVLVAVVDGDSRAVGGGGSPALSRLATAPRFVFVC